MKYYKNAKPSGMVLVFVIGLGLFIVLGPVLSPQYVIAANYGLDLAIAFGGYALLDVVLTLYTEVSKRDVKRNPKVSMLIAFGICSLFEFAQLIQTTASFMFSYHFRGTFDFPGDFIAYIVGIIISELVIQKFVYTTKSSL
ncbi:MAG: hypothetical protein UU77_C0001G0029 [candidate division WWE3 bacterium GW2011_GWC1_41_7]|uniref:Uncharacterized protein n=1 Tax=candidate division WWE3 bacterium GW2011_GWC1_41_7 TaxID=1619119 RepID=A0A0G0X913_UNCKA|nr:MAG: hypothetical protein UU77_C0001G0029 [candidate division WWE3 bacterium GW2011_GWC1_41_7]